MSAQTVMINRAPVLTLWATIVAERMGFEQDTACTLGKAVAGLNAQAKGRMLGIYGDPKGPHRGPPKKAGLGEEFWIEICGRSVPAKNTDQGVRAVIKDKPINPASVRRYLESKFGEDLTAVRGAMSELASACSPDDLAERAYALYERFRPEVPKGKRGWGAKGELDLDMIRALRNDL